MMGRVERMKVLHWGGRKDLDVALSFLVKAYLDVLTSGRKMDGFSRSKRSRCNTNSPFFTCLPSTSSDVSAASFASSRFLHPLRSANVDANYVTTGPLRYCGRRQRVTFLGAHRCNTAYQLVVIPTIGRTKLPQRDVSCGFRDPSDTIAGCKKNPI